MTEPDFCNLELNHSKFVGMFSKPCLQFVCIIKSIGSLVQEKFNDHSLIMLHPKCRVNGFYGIKWANNYGVNRRVKTDLIYSTVRRVHPLEISLCEMRTPELSPVGSGMHLATRRYFAIRF
jgi:hypothetical protein